MKNIVTINALKRKPIWFLWNMTNIGGRATKKPIAASGGATGTNDAYADTWVTYDVAINAAQRMSMSGVGLKIPDGFFFLDIDHKESSDPFVQTFLERYDSYAELSPSGNGIHILGLCDINRLPTEIDPKTGKIKISGEYYMNNRNLGLELYIGNCTNRYATYTGNVVVDKPLCDCTDAILMTLGQEMKREEKKISQKQTSANAANYTNMMTNNNAVGRQSVVEVIDALCRQANGAKFRKLFYDGDVGDYKSQSEADLALCCLIAYRVGDSPDLIDTIYRQSALMRDKWNRDDYRYNTISKAISNAKTNQRDIPAFVKIGVNGNKVLDEHMLAEEFKKRNKFIMITDQRKDNADIYVYYNGYYRQEGAQIVQGRLKKIVEQYDPKLIMPHKIKAAYQDLLMDTNYTDVSKLNENEEYINFENGLLHLTAEELKIYSHNPEILSTIRIPCIWQDNETPTPIFDQYINNLVSENVEVKQLIMEIIGAVISNIDCARMKKALIMVGPTNTGKSQLKTLVEKILGIGNYSAIDLAEMESKFGMADLYNKRLAGSSDMGFQIIRELKNIKRLTGGDTIYADNKYRPALNFRYRGLLWFCSNQLPKFAGDDGPAVYNRLIIVHCNNVIPDEEQDKSLCEKMYAEREGIIHKAIIAVQQVIRNGYRFSIPDCVKEAQVNYQIYNCNALEFFAECMQLRSGAIDDNCTTSRIYSVYKQWCCDKFISMCSFKEFGRKIAEFNKTTYDKITTRRNNGSYYIGYTLTDACKEKYHNILIDKENSQ